MKAARLKSELLSRKGAARPVTGVDAHHRNPAGHPILPALAAVDPGSAGPTSKGAGEGPQGPALKRDKFGRVRVSLRLDPRRHLRLRLLAAHSEMSLQETLIAALDAYLGDEAHSVTCDCLHGAGDPSQDDEPQAAGVQGAGVQDGE